MTRLTPDFDRRLRNEAMSLTEGRGAILDAARELSQALRSAGVEAPVVGGIAVVLHGHWRSTRDIDLLALSEPRAVAEVVVSLGFVHDPERPEFLRDGLPVHLVTLDRTGARPRGIVEIEGIATLDLADLIEMKLRSGLANPLRAQDLADVIGLIRRHRLGGEFARHLNRSLRPAFRKLAHAIAEEG